jgi:pyruvate,water dikinase
MMSASYIRWFSEVDSNDVPLVGGKNASLGEMYRHLADEGVNVPNGFAVTAKAYAYTLDKARIWPKLNRVLEGLDINDVDDLAARAHEARDQSQFRHAA